MSEFFHENGREVHAIKVPSYVDMRAPGYYANGIGGVNTKLIEAGENAQAAAQILVQFIFDSFPSVPDYSPALSIRFRDSLQVIDTFKGGRDLLQENILGYFRQVEADLRNGFSFSSNTDYFGSKPLRKEGRTATKVNLTGSIVEGSLAWNRFAQSKIENREMEQLFTEHPFTHAVRPAEGTKIPVGNLVVEVTPGVGRLELPAHRRQNLRARWGLKTLCIHGL